MSAFIDGPAKDVVLSLRRAPVMLRVVRGPKGWDALNNLEDVAAANETIHVYIMVGRAGHVHIRSSNRAASGIFANAIYRHLPEQPGEEHTRTNEAWAAWCNANWETLSAAKLAHDEAQRFDHPRP